MISLAVLVLLVISCAPRPDFSKERINDKVLLTAADWQNMEASAQLAPEHIHSWIPESGIRGRYQIAKSVLSIATIESIVGEEAFLSGPHADGVEYNSTKTFGRYNPKFLKKLRGILADVFDNKILVARAQRLYDRQLKQYLRTYYLAYEVGAGNQEVMDGYLSAIARAPQATSEPAFLSEPSEFIQESFRGFAEAIEKEGYDVYEGFTCPGFWVRRSIDGTADEFYDLLLLTMRTFDGAFLAEAGAGY